VVSRISTALDQDPYLPMASEPQHFRITYNEVHNLIKRSAKEIAEFKPDLILAIGTVPHSQNRGVSHGVRWQVEGKYPLSPVTRPKF
jgi:hypothetical protein